MAFTEKQLAQYQLTATGTPISVYAPPASTIGIIKYFRVANTGGASAAYSLFQDDNGTTYDATTCIASAQVVAAQGVSEGSVFWPMSDSTGNLAVDAVASGGAGTSVFTFTFWGAEIA